MTGTETMPNEFENMSIKKIEVRLQDADIFFTELPELIRYMRQQKRSNDIFRSLLESGESYQYDVHGEFEWDSNLGEYHRGVLTEEPEERNTFYETLRKCALEEFGVIRRDYQELKTRFDEIVAKEEAESKAAREAKSRDLEEANQGNDWDAIDRKHADVREGFVYVLTNTSMPGIIKLGFTTQSPPKRAAELSYRTPIPTPFSVACYWRVKDPYVVEQMLGSDLKEWNAGKEFYRLTPEYVAELVQEKYSEYLLDD